MHQVATGSGAAHPFIIPLTKIDVERRLVIGTAAEEIADKSREIMDYATARPQFEEWSNGFSTATGGLSKGNLRVMHTKTVAGRLDDISYDDVSKKVQIVAKVSDDNEWRKCLDGAYTGFSIGGGYLRKWKDPESGLTRYTPIVREISLVDNPCMPTATFCELVKADGIVEHLPLHGVLRGFAESWAQRPLGFADAWDARPRTFGDLYKRAGGHALSDAEHNQRIEAAKARWAQEIGRSREEVDHAVHAEIQRAGRGFFGKKAKMQREKALIERGFLHRSEAYEAHDKLLPHLPADSHGLIIMHPHLGHYDTHGAMNVLHDLDGDVDRLHGVAPDEVDGTIAEWKQEPGYKGPRDPADVLAGIKANREVTARAQVREMHAQHTDGLLTDREFMGRVSAVNLKYGTSHAEHPAAYRSSDRMPMSAEDAHMIAHGTPLTKRSKIPKRRMGDAVVLAHDWSEDKHPRGDHGRFTSGSGEPLEPATPTKAHWFASPKLSADDQALEPAKQEQWDLEHGRENRQNAIDAATEGGIGGAYLANVAAGNAGRAVRMARHGIGPQAQRNAAAEQMRWQPAYRQFVKARARAARMHALDGAPIHDSADDDFAVFNKLKQEAKARGSSEADAHAEAEKWAARLRRRRGAGGGAVLYENGRPVRYTSPAFAQAADSAASSAIHAGVEDARTIFGNGPKFGAPRTIPGKFVRRGLLGAVGAVAGVAGAQSAFRNQREAEGAQVTDAHHVLANTGDALRALSYVPMPQMIGAGLALPASLYHQGVRLPAKLERGSLVPTVAALRAVNRTQVGRHMGYGALIGGAIGLSRNLPALYREYSARHGGKES